MIDSAHWKPCSRCGGTGNFFYGGTGNVRSVYCVLCYGTGAVMRWPEFKELKESEFDE